MNVGENKGTRHPAGHSLRDVSPKAGVSAYAVSNYERELDVHGTLWVLDPMVKFKLVPSPREPLPSWISSSREGALLHVFAPNTEDG